MTETNLIILSYRKEYLLLAREEVLLPLNPQQEREMMTTPLMGENRLFKHMRKARENIIQEFLATIRAGYIPWVPRWIYDSYSYYETRKFQSL